MSRIGKQPIKIPQGVTVSVKGETVEIGGPNGTLSLKLKPEIKIETEKDQLLVKTTGKNEIARSLHGLTRTLIYNMIQGVTQNFEKTLKLVGTGYRVKIDAGKLILSLGFSHPVEVNPPAGIKFEVSNNDTIKVSGADKILVGQVAAHLRTIKPPEPYKGKGIRYFNERVKHKAGKAGKTGAAGGIAGGAK